MITDDLQSCFLQTNEHKTSVGSSAGTSNANCLETFSVDGCCGEPLEPQHITIDFTPDEETDTDFIQKKVCAFWEFIENCPEIHKLRVKADENIVLEVGNTSGSVSVSYKSGSGYGSKMDNSFNTMNRESHEKEEEESVAEKTAVEMLEFAEDKNLINRIFGAKMASTCSLGPREYPESTKPTQPKKKEKKKKPVCTCTSPTVTCKKPCKTQVSNLRLLSRELNDWDAKHPKSMEPPGHAPALQHCVIQRPVPHSFTCL